MFLYTLKNNYGRTTYIHSQNKPIQLGLCCLNTVLRKQKPTVFCSRKMIIRSIQEKGIEVLKDKIIQNLKDAISMIYWNEQHGIKVMRLSSEMFPHKSNPKVEDYDYDFAINLMKETGDTAKRNHRLTFHPGQYNVVGTPNKKSFQHTIEDLKYHADVSDYTRSIKTQLVVRGGTYGDRIIERLVFTIL